MPDDNDVKFLEPQDNSLGANAVGEPPLMYGIRLLRLPERHQSLPPGRRSDPRRPHSPEQDLVDLHRGIQRQSAPIAPDQPIVAYPKQPTVMLPSL